MCDVSVLKGKTLSDIRIVKDYDCEDVEIHFTTECGEVYKMYHQQSCYERVYIEDICGDLQDLIGSEILIAEEVEGEIPADFEDRYHESYTFTFYKFATRKGYVDIRWFGESNGYYSESVDFVKVK